MAEGLIDDSPTLIYEKQDHVAWLTLSRPDVLNAINLAMRDELWMTLAAVSDDPDVRVVIFKGAGRAFSAGADLTDFGTAPSIVEARRGRVDRDIWGRMLHMAKPLIAAVHGYAYGAGCELALLCDLRIASAEAIFCLPEVGLGYIPTAGGSQTLPRTIGRGRALHMILSGEPIGAQRALDYGLLHRIVPARDLHAEANALAERLLAAPFDAVLAAKAALVRGADLRLEDGLVLEAALGSKLQSAG